MKHKCSDNTLNTDSVSERNQEFGEKGKIKLQDVVALTQDVPEHNLRRGEVGTVVEILSNGEAYEVKFSDDDGQMSKGLSFPASQLEVFHQAPIQADSKRQATDSIEGYRYQILHSVNAWLDLADNDILYLEVAEDFDIESDGTFTATQVKHTQDNITLRSQQVIDGINNYWKLRTNNRDRRVKFRLLTKSKIVKEQGNPLETDKPGLEVWSGCSGDKAVIEKISELLQTDGKISAEVNDFLKVASPQEIYEQLIEPITWETDSKPISFVEQSISEKLVFRGDRYNILAFDAKKVVDSLLKEAWTVATQKEDRVLTQGRFIEIFEEKTMRMVPGHQWQQFQQMLDATKSVGAEFIGGSSDIVIQSDPHIQTDIPPLYLDVVVLRTELLTSIQTKLQSEGIVVIQGGVDKGKTTLAKLTANAIDADWFWLKFTNKKASQIVQDLKQLADAISNRSAQVNVILDDLNLQPQQLLEYEEVLGIVVYRVLERGAKLLITSQHKPIDNRTRNLRLSSSMVVNIPNFTTSEIEQFAEQLGCPVEHAKTWSEWIQIHTNGHPRLVHAQLVQLCEKDWKQQDISESLMPTMRESMKFVSGDTSIPPSFKPSTNILQSPLGVVEERETARQLLTDLPEDQREFLYRLSLMFTEFSEDCALNIGEIPESITHSGNIFSQLVGPWIDRVDETYYTISPLLTNAAEQVWSESKVKEFHAQVANAVLKASNLTTIEAQAILLHSMRGQNRESLIAVINALFKALENNCKEFGQKFSWLIHIRIDSLQKLFPGDVSVNYLFRSLQYSVAAEVEPEFAPKILEMWDKETKPYEPHGSYLWDRLILATKALKHYQVSLPVKQMVDYLKEIIDITNSDKEVWKIYRNFLVPLEEHKTDKSNFFSILFTFIYARHPISAPFLNDLIDALDELQPEIRALLLVNFGDDSYHPMLMIDRVWHTEAKRENPDWTECLHVYDKVIEITTAWGYPYIAAASARGKATIYDRYLHTPDTALEVLQDAELKIGPLPAIEEAKATIYFRQKRYEEADSILERVFPDWHSLGFGALGENRKAIVYLTNPNDYQNSAIFLQDEAKRVQQIENPEKHIGLYADAGFAHFKAGNTLDSINCLNLALQKI